MRIGPATLVFLKQLGDRQASEVLTKGIPLWRHAHKQNMTAGFFYSDGGFVITFLPIK